MIFQAISVLLLIHGVSAMQVKVESYECKEKAMTVTFNKICNQENTCYLGQDADVEGYMTYYGMVDEYGLDDSATAYVDLSITLATSSKTLYSQNVFQLEQFYLCDSSLQAEQDGDCPGGGRYKFQNQFFLPAVDNQVKDWAYSGFSGTAELIVYMGQDSSSTMLGYCTFELTTATSGIFSKVPNGKTALIGVFSAILVLLLCATLGCCFADRKNIKESVQKVPSATRKAAKATKQAVNKVAQKVTRLNKPSSDFKLMEDATTNEAKKSWQLDWDSKTCTGKHPAQKQMMHV